MKLSIFKILFSLILSLCLSPSFAQLGGGPGGGLGGTPPTIDGPDVITVGSGSLNPPILYQALNSSHFLNNWVSNPSTYIQTQSGTMVYLNVNTVPVGGTITLKYYYGKGLNNFVEKTITVLASTSNTPPPTPATPENISTSPCGNQTLSFKGTPPTGITWYWQTLPDGTDMTYSTSTLTLSTTGTYTYYLRAYDSSTSLWSDNSSASITATVSDIPTPINPEDNSVNSTIIGAGNAILSVTIPNGLQARWYENSTTTSIFHEGLNLTVPLTEGETKTYYVSTYDPTNPIADCAESGRISIIARSTIPGALPVLDQNLNYIVDYTILKEGVDSYEGTDGVLGLKQNEVLRSTTYFDGLGRAMQSVVTMASTNGKDIIQPVVYDKLGRQPKVYMPYVEGEDGKYKLNAVSNQLDFYSPSPSSGSPTPDIAHDTKPFAIAEFEASPRSRVLKQIGVGQDWHDFVDDNGNNTPKGTSSDYHIYDPSNQSDPEVRIWDYDYDTKGFSTLESFEVGDLVVSEIFDEEEGHVRQFTNKSGQVVLKQAFNTDDNGQEELLSTYYVYDDFGNLRLTIPPMAVADLEANNWDLNASCTSCNTENILDTYCYIYHYDHRQRLIEKKVPQTGWTTVVYDPLDRPILTQDAKQFNTTDPNVGQGAGGREWSFVKFDVWGRPVMSGLHYPPPSNDLTCFTSIPMSENPSEHRQTMQNAVDCFYGQSHRKLYEDPKPEVQGQSNSFYYTNNQAYPNHGTIVHTVTYYDDYDFNEDGVYDETVFQTYSELGLTDYNKRITGMVTKTRVRVLDNDGMLYGNTGTWLETIPFYDKYGRVIEVQADNHLGGKDYLYAEYDYVGKLLKDVLEHEINQSGNTQKIVVSNRHESDYLGRILASYQTVSDMTDLSNPITYPEELLVQYKYNEIGQVIQKIVGDGIQTMDYSFNIRGWLTGINDAERTDPNDLFGMNLYYNQVHQDLQIDANNDGTVEEGKALYNGNIAAIKWGSKLNKTHAYSYKYDKLNRLKSAKYQKFDPNNPSLLLDPSTYDEDYSVSNIQYDLNGNIKKLVRQGVVAMTQPTINNPSTFTFDTMDDLTYTYRGNQLIAVDDAAETLLNPTGVAGDFSEVRPSEADPQQLEERKYQTGHHEYLYDELGNVIKDKNKGIKSISYNHLNLIETVVYENDKVIEYHYDATGIKLSKTISDENGTSIGITHYIGTFVYEGDGASFDLDFMHTSQGRLLFPQSINAHVSTAEYEYHYTDHLGNLRVAFRDGRQYAYTATMELDNASIEESEFANIFITRDGTAAQAGTQSAKVNSGGNPLGPWKSIPVQAGDTISATVYSHYKAAPSNNTFNWGIFLGNAPTYGDYTDPNSGENIISPFNAQNLLINVGAVIPAGSTDSNGDEVPNAYLRLLFYDKDNQLRDEKVVQVSALSKNTWLEQLDMGNYVASEAGRIEVFVANESDTDVWFDNLTIIHKEALIVQENAYYPFGLEMTGLQKDNHNKFTFNAQSEKQKDLLGSGYFYETPFRGYDPQLGRFHGVDALADFFSEITPYQFAYNNPVRFNDPTGLFSQGPGPSGQPKPDNPTNRVSPPPDDIYINERFIVVKVVKTNRPNRIFFKKAKGENFRQISKNASDNILDIYKKGTNLKEQYGIKSLDKLLKQIGLHNSMGIKNLFEYTILAIFGGNGTRVALAGVKLAAKVKVGTKKAVSKADAFSKTVQQRINWLTNQLRLYLRKLNKKQYEKLEKKIGKKNLKELEKFLFREGKENIAPKITPKKKPQENAEALKSWAELLNTVFEFLKDLYGG